MKLTDLVSLLDIDRQLDPSQDIEDCAEILMDEGWEFEQVAYWVGAAYVLQSHTLELSLGMRVN